MVGQAGERKSGRLVLTLAVVAKEAFAPSLSFSLPLILGEEKFSGKEISGFLTVGCATSLLTCQVMWKDIRKCVSLVSLG